MVHNRKIKYFHKIINANCENLTNDEVDIIMNLIIYNGIIYMIIMKNQIEIIYCVLNLFYIKLYFLQNN